MPKSKGKKSKRNLTSETDEDLALTIELAEEGDVLWQKHLVEMYSHGTKIPKNDVLAFHWALKAALQGDPDSILHVGMSYLQGLGVQQVKQEAIKWLSRLAYPETSEAEFSRQMPDAQSLMSGAYYSQGEPHDISLAYGWLLLAICYSQPWDVEETPFNSNILRLQREGIEMFEHAKAQIESEMTPEQRSEGQQFATKHFRPINHDDATSDE
jgi:TPR repeat protein